MLVKLERFLRGYNKNVAPTSPIMFLLRIREIFDKLVRFLRGDRSSYAPIYPIAFSVKLRDNFKRFLRLRRGDKKKLCTSVFNQITLKV